MRCGLLLAVAAAAVSCTQGFILGVDFGSEFMKVSLVQNGKPFEVVNNIHSKRKTPTMLAFYKGDRLFGADAEQIATRKPHCVLRNPHTLLGRNMSDPVVEAHVQKPYILYDVVPSAHGGVALHMPPHEDCFPEGRTFTVEELSAMLLAYAKHFASVFAEGAPISDAVITVPAFYSQQHRLALLDAASLAGLRVLTLLDENTAAGVQFGIDKVFENSTHNVLMYNAGSANVQASVVQYSAYKGKGLGKSKVGQGHVLGACWETGVGGGAVTETLLELLADAVNAKHGAALGGVDVRTLHRPIAKLAKAARKAKEVLSANSQYTVFVEALTPDIDFAHNVKRGDLEEAAADTLAGAMSPVACALSRANLTLADIHAVELLGGGVRTPAVQTLLQDTLGPDVPLGVHMNGDEAMALGAAFVGANRSSLFRVRAVGMIPTSPFGVSVELGELPGAQVPEGEEAWSKRSALFRNGNKLGNLKKLSFKHSRDIVASLAYTPEAPLPPATQSFLATYNITGVAEAVAAHAELEEPKVSLSFQLDHNGIARVTKAEAAFEEWVTPTPKPTPASKARKAAAEEEEQPAGEGGEEKPTGEESEKPATEGEEEKPAVEEEAKPAGEGEEEKPAGEEEATPTPEPTSLPKPKRRVIKVPLTVTLASTPPFLRPMNATEVAEAKAVLAELQAIDDNKALREAAKSSLEAYIYAARAKLGEMYEEVEAVSTEEQREGASAALEAGEDWLYDEGDDTDLATYQAKDEELKGLVEPMLARAAEAAARPGALASAAKFIADTRATVADWNETRPWLTDVQLNLVGDAVDTMEMWVSLQVAAQEAKEAHEEPAFTVAQLKAKRRPVKTHLNLLKRIPKPTPTPTPTPEAKAEEGEGTEEAVPENKYGGAEEAAGEEEEAKTEEGATEEPAVEPEVEGEAATEEPAVEEAEEAAASEEAPAAEDASTSSEEEL